MNWEEHTIHTLKKLYNDESYQKWSDSIQEGVIKNFSGNLDELLSRLSGLILSEFELGIEEKEKIMKIMELAAAAGKTL